jgi:uncharacterized membrane protein
MKDKGYNVTDIFAIGAGIFFLIEGIWGFFSPVTFGVFTTNIAHSVIHVFLGALAIVLAVTHQNSKGYLKFLGVLLLIVGIVRFIPTAQDIVINMLAVNVAVAILNIVLGTACLLTAYLGNKHGVPAQHNHQHPAV